MRGPSGLSCAPDATEVTVRTFEVCSGEIAPASTAVTLYTVPAGRTVILKDVRLWVSGGSSSLIVFALDRSGGVLVPLLYETVPTLGVRSIMPFAVLEQGDTIKASSSQAASVRYWCSGALLDGVA